MSDHLKTVCSNTVRASTQTQRGNQWWRREVHHLSSGGKFTLCGRDCTDWLVMREHATEQDADSNECCKRCAKNVSMFNQRRFLAQGDGE